MFHHISDRFQCLSNTRKKVFSQDILHFTCNFKQKSELGIFFFWCTSWQSSSCSRVVLGAALTLITLSKEKGSTIILLHKAAAGLFVFPSSFSNVNLSLQFLKQFCLLSLSLWTCLEVFLYLKTPRVTVFKDFSGCLLCLRSTSAVQRKFSGLPGR